jgi:hypothetical protein
MSSWSRRGTRTAQRLSRKCRFSSPSIVGVAKLEIESLDRLEESDQRDLQEIVVAFAAPSEAPGDRFGQPDVHLDEPVPQAAVLGAAKLDEERRPLLRVDGHVSDAGRA